MEATGGDQLRVRVREAGNYSKGAGGGGGGGDGGFFSSSFSSGSSMATGIAIGFVAAAGLGLLGKLASRRLWRQRPPKRKEEDPEVEVLEAVVHGDLARNPSRLAVQMLDLEPHELVLSQRKAIINITKAAAAAHEMIIKEDSKYDDDDDAILRSATTTTTTTPKIGLSSLIVNNHGVVTNGYRNVRKARDAPDGDNDDNDDGNDDGDDVGDDAGDDESDDVKKHTDCVVVADEYHAVIDEATHTQQPQTLVNGFRLNEIQGTPQVAETRA